MGDIAFKYDKDKGFADIQVVGGDFLLCDTDVTEPKYEKNEDSITISGTGTTMDDTLYLDGLRNGKNLYTNNPGGSYVRSCYWTGIDWFMVDTSAQESWTQNTIAGDLPPETGWSIGDSGSPAPTITYDYNISEVLLASATSLEVACGLSLFTDRRATVAEIKEFQTGITERQSRRGFWANTFRSFSQGSGLWLLSRSKRQEITRSRAETYAIESLQWLKDDGIAQDVEVEAALSGRSGLDLQVRVLKPSGEELNYKYQYVWE